MIASRYLIRVIVRRQNVSRFASVTSAASSSATKEVNFVLCVVFQGQL